MHACSHVFSFFDSVKKPKDEETLISKVPVLSPPQKNVEVKEERLPQSKPLSPKPKASDINSNITVTERVIEIESKKRPQLAAHSDNISATEYFTKGIVSTHLFWCTLLLALCLTLKLWDKSMVFYKHSQYIYQCLMHQSADYNKHRLETLSALSEIRVK